MPAQAQESPAVVASKKYAKHLGNLLKPHVGLSHSECLNIIARMQGAKNWNTYHACNGYGFGSNFVPAESNQMVAFDGLPIFGELNRLLRNTILPTIREHAKANALEVLQRRSDGEEYGYPEMTLIHGAHVPAIEYDVSIEPAGGLKKGDCSFHGELILSRHSVAIRASNLYLGFPADAADVAFRIVRDKRMDTGDVINVEVAEPGSDSPYPIAINLQGVFGLWSGSARTHLGDLAADTEEMRHEMRLTWKEFAQKLSQVAKIFNAYGRYAGKWKNEAAVTKFIEAIGDILSGEPRYRQVSTCFYETTIKNKTFRIIVDDHGPYIICGRGGVELDRGEVIHVDEDFVDHREVRTAGYHIAKYGNRNEIRISLEGFGPVAFRRLSKEVGARLLMKGTYAYDFHDFHKSKAFDGLKKWMIENPRFARELTGKHEWYDAALEHIIAK